MTGEVSSPSFCQQCDGAGLVGGRAAGATPNEIREAVNRGASFCTCEAGVLARGISERDLAAAPLKTSRRRIFARKEAGNTEAVFRRARVDSFLRTMGDTIPRRVIRADIWRLAGHGEATMFERWQRGAYVSPGTASKFEKVLRMNPETFIEKLTMIRRLKKTSSPDSRHY